MPSSITVSSLTAVPGVGLIALAAIAAPPAGFEDLSYMKPANIEFWSATVNNRGSATLVGSSVTGLFNHGGLGVSVTRYYWARVIDPAGNEGPFFPVSATAGVSATTLATAPPANSVGTTQLQNGAVTNAKIGSLAVDTANIANAAITNAKIGNLEVDNAKIQNIAANKLLAGTITAAISITSPTITGGTITGGSINGTTFTGGMFQTKASGARITIDGTNNIFNSEDSSGRNWASMSAGGLASAAAAFNNYANFYCLYSEAHSTGSESYGIRAKNTGGGHGVVGCPSVGGGYAFAAITGKINSPAGYAPFTGMHEMLVRKTSSLALGEIASVKRIIAKGGMNNVLAEIEQTNTIADRRTIGVVSERKPLTNKIWLSALEEKPNESDNISPVRQHLVDNYDLVTVNALGEGQMSVCGRGGALEAGDYIVTSDLAGQGQRQNDVNGDAEDILRRGTVAQAMIGVTFDDPDQIKLVPVFYRCG